MTKNQGIALAAVGALAAIALAVFLVVGSGDEGSTESSAGQEQVSNRGFPGISAQAQPKDGADTGAGRGDILTRAEVRRKERKSRRVRERAAKVREKNLSKYDHRTVKDFNQPIYLKEGEVTEIVRPFRAAVPLVIKASKDDVLYVHGYQLRQPVPGGDYGHLTFDASMAGRFVIELEKANERVAVLVVKEEKKDNK